MMNVLAGGDRSRLNLQIKKKNGKWNERTEKIKIGGDEMKWQD